MKGGHGIFGVRNHLGACCGRDGETGTNESVQVMTRKKWEGKKSFSLCHVTQSQCRSIGTEFTGRRQPQKLLLIVFPGLPKLCMVLSFGSVPIAPNTMLLPSAHAFFSPRVFSVGSVQYSRRSCLPCRCGGNPTLPVPFP